jgi:ArsR family transcriptional regulator
MVRRRQRGGGKGENQSDDNRPVTPQDIQAALLGGIMIKTEARKYRLLDSEVLERASSTYKVLSHPVRLRIIELLQREELAVCELAAKLDLPQATLSQHLNRMRSCGVVAGERKGQRMFYSVVSMQANAMIDCLREGEDRL